MRSILRAQAIGQALKWGRPVVQLQQLAQTRAFSSFGAPGVAGASHGLTELTSIRSVIAVRGPDALTFLQGLTTNDVRALAAPHAAQFTAFLNSKGRAIFEAILSRAPAGVTAVSFPVVTAAPPAGSPPGTPVSTSTSAQSKWAMSPEVPCILIETAAAQADDMLAHLKRYKLRAKVDIIDLRGSHRVWAALPLDPFATIPSGSLLRAGGPAAAGATGSIPAGSGAGARPLTHDPRSLISRAHHVLQATAAAGSPGAAAVAYRDPRVHRLGVRVLAPASTELSASLGLPCVPQLDYHALRFLHGVPEGPEVSDVMPLEWNLPFLRGVVFDKGCYVGQELIARTHFRGVVRKRYVPVYLTAGGAPPRPPALANPVEAMLTPRSASAVAGGHGHGKGHGPAQTHDFPASAASGHQQRHSRIEGGSGSHAATVAAAHSPGLAASLEGAAAHGDAAHHKHVGIPFPYVDRHWRGAVAPGTSLVTGEASPGGAGSRAPGKLVAWVPGLNLGLAVLRLQPTLSHMLLGNGELPPSSGALPQGPQEQEEELPRGLTPEGVDIGARGFAGSEEALLAQEDDEAYWEPEVAQAYIKLHEAARDGPVTDLSVAAASSTSVDAPLADQSYRVVPVLPPFWRRLPALPTDTEGGE